jgi:hypothetical protein
MAILYPSRRILGSPAWLWIGLAVLLFSLADPKGDFVDPDLDNRPPTFGSPARAALGSDLIYVARKDDSFRFMSYEDRKIGIPLWRVFVELSDQKESFSCGGSYFLPGLIRREAHWTCALKANRVDRDWKGDKDNPYELPAEQIQKLRPLLVVELNRRNPWTKLGDRLEKMLNDGLEASSTSFPPQNAFIMLRWLAMLMAVIGLVSMFLRPRPVSRRPGVLPMSQNEVLLTKIATVRARLNARYKDAC